VKAIGVALASRGIVQVSMNLTDYRVTSMATAFHAVQTESAKAGVEIAESELIGLVPQAALDQAASALLQIRRFDSTQILETRLAGTTPPIAGYLHALASATPTPAVEGLRRWRSPAASLGTMGARIGKQSSPSEPAI
jgi:glutamate formiminotransferase/glutamate formiminotransferase/formiminotetrahydrofolate cyclodeaminase